MLEWMTRRVVEVHKRSLNVNADKSNGMMFGGEKGLVYKVNIDGVQLKHV